MSLWTAPILLVPKKNGDLRLVVDYRKLNKVTKKDAYPLPHVDDLVNAIGKAMMFSALDMHSGFHQVLLDPESSEKTGFVTRFGTYKYITMLMGLMNAPATF